MRATDADDVDGSLLATPVSFTPGGDDRVHGGYLGAGIHFAPAERFQLSADVEVGLAEGDEVTATARIGFSYRF